MIGRSKRSRTITPVWRNDNRFRMRQLFLIVVVVVGGSFGACTRAEEFGPWQLSGDLRVAYAASWRDARDGKQRDSDSLGARFRLRLRRDLSDAWRIQSRLAGTFEDQRNETEFFIRSQRQSGTSIAPGSVTLDELFVRWRSGDRTTQLQLGRFQSTLKLPLITNKSLDRNQASNIDIGWTDGIQFSRVFARGWEGLLVAQYNGHDGNGTPTRGPIDFRASNSRVSTFAALANEQSWGPIVQRALAITWYPDALASNGVDDAVREDYVTATFKLAAGWDLNARTRLVLGGELGHAFETPTNAAMRLDGSGDSDGFGWVLGADLVELFPGHTVGVVFAEADAGWLISNDIRQNDSLAELRWQWQITESLRSEFRARWRYEQEIRSGAPQKQRDRDMRARFTWSF